MPNACNVPSRTIFTGDNLDILRGINSECIDLIYLDPPFKSDKTYAVPLDREANDVGRRYGRIHDSILFYSKSESYKWTDYLVD